jgi:hypothetical protein
MKPSAVMVLAIIILLGSLVAFGISRLFSVEQPQETERVAAIPIQDELSPPVSPPENLTWVEKVPEAPWSPRDSGEAFLFRDKLWLMGGLNGNDEVGGDAESLAYWEMQHFNDIWNTGDGITWRQVAISSAWAPRRSMSVALFRDRLWMLGGWSPLTGYSSDIWVSDDGRKWKKIVPRAPFQAVEGQTLTVFNNKLWKIGGVNYDVRKTTNDIWYSENGTDWTRVENVPWKPRWDHAVAVFDGKLFLAGGMNLAGDVFSDVWISKDGMDWELITDKAPWEARQGHALHVHRGKLWIIGRLNDKESGGKNDVWFSHDGISWQKTTSDPAWTGREDFFSTVFKGRIWVFGGMDARWQWRNDVWASE